LIECKMYSTKHIVQTFDVYFFGGMMYEESIRR
jgi:hypothetical protein